MAHRIVPPIPAKVAELLDEHTDLMVNISLEADAPKPDADRLLKMQRRLVQVENEIKEFRLQSYR